MTQKVISKETAVSIGLLLVIIGAVAFVMTIKTDIELVKNDMSYIKEDIADIKAAVQYNGNYAFEKANCSELDCQLAATLLSAGVVKLDGDLDGVACEGKCK